MNQFTVQTKDGKPIPPYISADVSNTGNFADRPNLVGDPKLDHPTPELWLNTRAFAIPPRYTYGNAGRNILLSDRLTNFDIAVMRNIPFWENKVLQVRAEFFNVFNHANFALPIATADSARFGTVPATATDPRDVQFGIKIIF